jgi:hypothetical protein
MSSEQVMQSHGNIHELVKNDFGDLVL